MPSKSPPDFVFRSALQTVYLNLYALCANLTGYDQNMLEYISVTSDDQAWNIIEDSFVRARRILRDSYSSDYETHLAIAERCIYDVSSWLTKWRLVRKEKIIADQRDAYREPILQEITRWKDNLRKRAWSIMIDEIGGKSAYSL